RERYARNGAAASATSSPAGSPTAAATTAVKIRFSTGLHAPDVAIHRKLAASRARVQAHDSARARRTPRDASRARPGFALYPAAPTEDRGDDVGCCEPPAPCCSCARSTVRHQIWAAL